MKDNIFKAFRHQEGADRIHDDAFQMIDTMDGKRKAAHHSPSKGETGKTASKMTGATCKAPAGLKSKPAASAMKAKSTAAKSKPAAKTTVKAAAKKSAPKAAAKGSAKAKPRGKNDDTVGFIIIEETYTIE